MLVKLLLRRWELHYFYSSYSCICSNQSARYNFVIQGCLKGEYDDAISNALGSNIFDICFALGLPIFAYTLIKGPIVMPPTTLSDVIELQISLIILTVASFYIFYFNKGLRTRHSIYLVGLYILFVGFIFINAYL